MTMTCAPVLQASCSICTHAQDAECEGGQHPIADVLRDIVSGRWASEVDAIHALLDFDEEEVAAAKRRLPGALFSGTFSRRAKASLIARTGILCVDLDGKSNMDTLPDPTGISAVKGVLAESPHVAAAFVSPSGTGLKVLVHVDTARSHDECFAACERYFAAYGLTIDPACKDVSRLCFVSHDANAYIATRTTALDCSPEKSETTYTLPAADLKPGDDFNLRGDGDVRELLRAHGWKQHGPSGKYWTRPGKSSGVSASLGCIKGGGFHCFTSNAAPFEGDKSYSLFGVFATLECNGDFRAASGKLRGRGYGADRQKPLSSPALPPPPATEGTEPQPAGTPAMSEDEKILAMLAARQFDPDAEPPPTVPVFTLAGICISTAGNLTAITAQAKVGKSAFLAAMIAASMWHEDNGDVDLLGVTGANTASKAVLHFDTEQSRDDFWHLVNRARKRANAPSTPPWLHAYSVADLPVAKARRAITLAMEAQAKAHGGIHSVFLDGVADFVADVNDAEECNGFVAELHALAIRFSCPIICVIHLNPGGEKERGHLGSQLVRKAESNLKLEKDDAVTVVWSEKQRRAPIFKDKGPRFAWSNELMMHTSCETVSDRRDEKKAKVMRLFAEEIFAKLGKDALGWADLVNGIQSIRKVGPSTAEDRFSKMKAFGVIAKQPMTGLWVMTPRNPV